MNNYILNFFEDLWENPKLVAELIIISDINDIKETLSNLFMNYFYENILSDNSIENNLMYVLTLLIQDEIKNIKNIDDYDKFMGKGSKVGCFMDELRKKSDIKNYFKKSFLNFISDLESKSSINFSLEVEQILKNLRNKKKSNKRDDSDNSFFDEMKFDDLELDLLIAKNLSPLTIKNMNIIISQSQKTDQDMNDYINNNINNSQEESHYSNLKLMEKFYINGNLSSQLITIYTKKFCLIKEFIDKFISILEKNLNFLPYSIKCLCKIINVLVQKKFPHINLSQKNAFISQFFFKKIIMPIFADPGIELLINNFIISGFTLLNLGIIKEILSKFFSGRLFENNNDNLYNCYTPFNWYFLEKMPEIFKIFSKLIDIELPPFIDDLINDKLDPNFIYDYFELNKDEKIMNYSVCFNHQDLKVILNGFALLNDKVDISKYKNGNYLLSSFERLNSQRSKKEIDNLEKRNYNSSSFISNKKDRNSIRRVNTEFITSKEQDNTIRKDIFEEEVENYYLLQKLNASNEYKNLFNIKSDSKNNFNLKEVKSTDNRENNSRNIIIKTKNCFSDLLYNIDKLQKSNYFHCNINNTFEILNSIKNYSKLFNFSSPNSIPTEWYCDSILDLIKNIPEDYSINDLEKLYDEMEQDLNLSINSFKIDFLCEYANRLKCIEKEQFYYKEFFKIFKDLELNLKVNHIIENDFIPVKITFNYGVENISLTIEKIKIKKEEFKKIKLKEKTSHSQLYERHCKSIKSFIDNFPDFSVFQEKQDIDILKLQQNLSVPKKIKDYIFSIIKEHLIQEQKIDKDFDIDLTQTEYKIYDYIMSKINYKIFPKTYDEDDKLYKCLFKLSWIEPKHLISKKSNYFLNSFLPEVIENFKLLEKEKSPRKKILILTGIFELISKVILFNGGNQTFSLDDQMPILIYCFIKAQPFRIGSNLKFIKIYRNSLIDKGNENELEQLIALCEFVKKINYKNLYDISQEEYIKNCNEVINAGNRMLK